MVCGFRIMVPVLLAGIAFSIPGSARADPADGDPLLAIPALRGEIMEEPEQPAEPEPQRGAPRVPPPRNVPSGPFEKAVAAYDTGDYKTALALWKPLADKGDIAAMRNVAHLYRMGLGTKADFRQALAYYRKAAQAGLPAAQVNLGLMVLNGEGTDADPREAARWFYRAARAGSTNAQYFLAQQLEVGNGVEADLQAAQAYYRAAARAGHEPSIALLSERGIAADAPPPSDRLETGQTNQAAAPNLPRKAIKTLYGGTGIEDGFETDGTDP